jgi:hypothetical protein
MVLTVSFVISSVTGLFVTVARKKLASHELDASTGASEPHDFAVRNKRFRPACLRPPDAVASTASHPNVRDDHDTPLWRGGMAAL